MFPERNSRRTDWRDGGTRDCGLQEDLQLLIDPQRLQGAYQRQISNMKREVATQGSGAKAETTRRHLHSIVKDSSEKNRNFFIAWLVFALYVCITVAGTADVQLLLPETGVYLPVLGVQMPLLTFYLVVPFVVLAFQFNLLHNLDAHAYKLEMWRQAWRGAPPRVELQVFVFDFAALERGGAFELSLRAANSILCYWLGPIVIATILIRFSDYQAPIYTSLHFVVLLISLYFAIIARIRLPMAMRHGKKRYLAWEYTLYAVTGALASIITILPVLVTWGLELRSPLAEWFMREVEQSYESPEFFREFLLPRLNIPATAQLAPVDGQAELRAKIAGQTVDEWWREHGGGISLRGRNLRFASFVGTNLHKADFYMARADHANFANASLQGTRFEFASLGNARLTNIRADGSYWVGADLSYAELFGAKLRGADLSSVEMYALTALRGARFRYAELQGADLRGADLVFTDLSNAKLHGAALEYANLSGATLDETELHGATMNGASLEGASLVDVQAPGVDFEMARVEGAAMVRLYLSSRPAWSGTPITLSLRETTKEPDWEEILRVPMDYTTKNRIVSARKKVREPHDADLGLRIAELGPELFESHHEVAKRLALRWCEMFGGPANPRLFKALLVSLQSWPHYLESRGASNVAIAAWGTELRSDLIEQLADCKALRAQMCDAAPELAATPWHRVVPWLWQVPAVCTNTRAMAN